VIDGGAGMDSIYDSAVGDVTLTDAAMSGNGSDSLASIEYVSLFGGNNDQRFDASGFSGRVTISAAGGADTVIGAAGPDWIFGGAGDDELNGGGDRDGLFGDAGDDRLLSDDGTTEPVDCGDGTDTAIADAFDGLTACEQIDRGGPASESDPDGDPPPPPVPGAPSNPKLPGTPAADAIAPSLSRVDLSRAAFRAARRGAALATRSAGTAVRFTLSEPAAVTFRIRRVGPGGRTVRLRGRIVAGGDAGANRVVLRGRLRGRTLRPGRYRLVARAVDAAGNRSSARRVAFRIVTSS
jgi:Ca2+-binding RTX toxin-like protein